MFRKPFESPLEKKEAAFTDNIGFSQSQLLLTCPQISAHFPCLYIQQFWKYQKLFSVLYWVWRNQSFLMQSDRFYLLTFYLILNIFNINWWLPYKSISSVLSLTALPLSVTAKKILQSIGLQLKICQHLLWILLICPEHPGDDQGCDVDHVLSLQPLLHYADSISHPSSACKTL